MAQGLHAFNGLDEALHVMDELTTLADARSRCVASSRGSDVE
jgi:hypothetical protein